jgi:hypothetical protein
MHSLITIGIKALEVLFFAGIFGAALVILLTGFEDIKTMFSKNDEEE